MKTCENCKWFGEKPKPRKWWSLQDKELPKWCWFHNMGTREEMLRCGGGDFQEKEKYDKPEKWFELEKQQQQNKE